MSEMHIIHKCLKELLGNRENGNLDERVPVRHVDAG